MNIVEAAKMLKEGQVAHSKEIDTRIMKDESGYRLHYIDHIGNVGREIQFNANEWCSEDWEIEIEWVDFWTAWQARINQGKKIRSEFWHKTIHFDICLPSGKGKVSEKEIDGKWQIID